MMMLQVVEEAGYLPAMVGLSLSYDSPLANMPARARALAHKNGGHNKFLESLMVWLDVTAPRYWWQQADTYRIGTKQSGSTMHTILRRPLRQSDFARPLPLDFLSHLNRLIEEKAFDELKSALPEGFLQRRVCCYSYKTLQNMYAQRRNHRLVEWHVFFEHLIRQLKHPEFIQVDHGKEEVESQGHS